VLSAAFEAPLDDADRDVLGDEALERAATLPELKNTPAGYVWAGRDYPAARIPLRSTSPDSFSVIDTTTGAVLGLVERERAYSTVHEGAVYLHLGEAYRVAELDLDARQALVSPFSGDLYTQAKKDTMTAIDEARRTEQRLGLELSWGAVSVTEQVIAYQVKQVSTQATLDLVPLDLPETSFETEAIWFCPEPDMLEGIERMPKLLGSLHAAEHALIALLPLWAMCDRWDIGGLSTNVHFQTGRPTVFVYDGHAGGVGITARGFEAFEGWVADTARMIAGCPCEQGCPSCVQSPKCGNLNDMLDKAGALELLRRMLAYCSAAGGASTSTGHGAFASTCRTVVSKRERPYARRLRGAAITTTSAPSSSASSTIAGPASRARILRARSRNPKASATASARCSASRAAASSSSIRASRGRSGETSITYTTTTSAPRSAASAQAISSERRQSGAPEIGTRSRRYSTVRT
jgi:ATP-dependent helicase YprA (DUF1998 family)